MPAATQTEVLSRRTLHSGNVSAVFVDETKGSGYAIWSIFRNLNRGRSILIDLVAGFDPI
jgi:hypothetical protein